MKFKIVIETPDVASVKIDKLINAIQLYSPSGTTVQTSVGPDDIVPDETYRRQGNVWTKVEKEAK